MPTVLEDDLVMSLRAKQHVQPPKEAPCAEHYKSWNGWDIFRERDNDGDVEKQTFFAVHQDTGETRDIDVSPYYPDWRVIVRVVDLGFPRRTGPSPLTAADLDQIEAGMKVAAQ